MRARTIVTLLACLSTGATLASCVGLQTTVPASPTARKVSGATAPIVLPEGWTSTPTEVPSATSRPTIPPTPTPTPTPRPTYTPKPTTTPIATFMVEGASTDDIVVYAFDSYRRKDESALRRLYTDGAADLCRLSFGSITKCIGIPYQTHGLIGLQSWYLLPDEPAQEGSILEVETVITKWSNNDNLWRHAFLLTRVDGRWQITEPQADIDVYEK